MARSNPNILSQIDTTSFGARLTDLRDARAKRQESAAITESNLQSAAVGREATQRKSDQGLKKAKLKAFTLDSMAWRDILDAGDPKAIGALGANLVQQAGELGGDTNTLTRVVNLASQDPKAAAEFFDKHVQPNIKRISPELFGTAKTKEPFKTIQLADGRFIQVDPNTNKETSSPRNEPKGTTVNVDIKSKGDSAFAQAFGKSRADEFTQLKTDAQAASDNNQSLQLIRSSSDEAAEGAVQPLFTMLKSIGVSLGFDPAGLTEETLIGKGSADILANYMKSLGARGLTDQDIKILERTLPQANQSKEARTIIIDLLEKRNNSIIQEFSTSHAAVGEKFPDLFNPSPGFLGEFNGGLSADEQAELESLEAELGRQP